MYNYIIVNRHDGRLFGKLETSKRKANRIRKTIYGYDDWVVLKVVASF